MKPQWQALIGVVTAAVAVALIVRDQHNSSQMVAGRTIFSKEHTNGTASAYDIGRPGKSDRTPASLSQVPPLLKKLELVNLAKEPALLVYTSDTVIGEPDSESKFKFRLQFIRNNRPVKVNSGFVQVERNIFTDGPFRDRFFLKKIERRVGKNPRNGLEETNMFAIIEDRAAGKVGETHEIKKGSRNGKIIRNYTAALRLDLPAERDKQMKVVDGQSFSLPVGQETQRRYKFAGVEGEGQVVIEYEGTSARVGRFYLSSSSTE